MPGPAALIASDDEVSLNKFFMGKRTSGRLQGLAPGDELDDDDDEGSDSCRRTSTWPSSLYVALWCRRAAATRAPRAAPASNETIGN